MTLKFQMPKWLVSVSDWLDTHVFTDPVEMTQAKAHAYNAHITDVAYELNRYVKSCQTFTHTYVVLDMLDCFTCLYGHTAIGKHAAMGILKEIRAIEKEIDNRIFNYQTIKPLAHVHSSN